MQNSDATFQRIQDTLAQIAEQQRQADARSAEFNRELEAFRRQEEERSAVFNRQLDAFRRQTAAEEKQRKQIADAEMAEIRKNINNVSKEWGDFNNNEGERIEEEFAAALSENMQIGGIRLDEIIRRTKNRYEYDLVGINGSATVVGEVKRKITAKSVRDFCQKTPAVFWRTISDACRQSQNIRHGWRYTNYAVCNKGGGKIRLFCIAVKKQSVNCGKHRQRPSV